MVNLRLESKFWLENQSEQPLFLYFLFAFDLLKLLLQRAMKAIKPESLKLGNLSDTLALDCRRLLRHFIGEINRHSLGTANAVSHGSVGITSDCRSVVSFDKRRVAIR